MGTESYPTKLEGTLFQSYTQGGTYGQWGYPGACVEQSIRSDRVDMLKECIERDWIDDNCKTLDGCGMVKHARRCGSDKVVKHMLKVGWKDEAWPHGITVGPRKR